MKTRERVTSELTTQLSSTQLQLETITSELETVRCRAVRGGAEVERWHSDLTSLQVTNKFLSAQMSDLREKLLLKERHLAEMSKRVQQSLPKEADSGRAGVAFHTATIIRLFAEGR